VTLPWYVLCTWANGAAFWKEFFWKQNVERFVSSTAVGQHGQPFWYFGAILLALLLPWTPLLPLVLRRAFYTDTGRLFLLAWVVLCLIFFSAAANKLPSYILPLIPAAAALLGVALEEVRDAAPWLAACAVLLIAFPMAAPLLPTAVASGLSHAPAPQFHWSWLLPVPIAVLAWVLDRTRRRLGAVLTLVTGAVIGTVMMKTTAAPDLDRVASARTLRLQLGTQQDNVCVDWVPRGMQYSLDYYFVPQLPKCTQTSRPLWLHQLAGQMPALSAPKSTQ
jgi:4-amino-4-deoxy-L-arabinose transferase-like glycosyltransferase